MHMCMCFVLKKQASEKKSHFYVVFQNGLQLFCLFVFFVVVVVCLLLMLGRKVEIWIEFDWGMQGSSLYIYRGTDAFSCTPVFVH